MRPPISFYLIFQDKMVNQERARQSVIGVRSGPMNTDLFMPSLRRDSEEMTGNSRQILTETSPPKHSFLFSICSYAQVQICVYEGFSNEAHLFPFFCLVSTSVSKRPSGGRYPKLPERQRCLRFVAAPPAGGRLGAASREWK